MWNIVLIGIVLVIFVAFYLLVEFVTKDKKKVEVKVEKAVEEVVTPNSVAPEDTVMVSLESNRNLADDLQVLLAEQSHNAVAHENYVREKRSHLLHTGRMRDYYENKHRPRNNLSEVYDLPTNEPVYVSQPSSGIQLTADDVMRLKMMQEVFERKGYFDDDNGVGGGQNY
jgi:hypothetical protein